MPRIRTFKPAFWAHPAMGRASDGAKCLALALLNFADDEGYFQADPALVRNFARPFDAIPQLTADLMDEVWRIEWTEIRQHPTYGALGWVVKFRNHQVISKPQKSSLKAYFEKAEKRSPPPPRPDQSCAAPCPFHSGSSTVPSGKGMEGNGREEEEAAHAGAHGTPPAPIAAPAEKPAAAGQGKTQEPDSPLVVYLRRGWPELEDPAVFARVCAEAYGGMDLVAVAKRARAAMQADNPRGKPAAKYLRDWFDRETRGPLASSGLLRGGPPARGAGGQETGRRTPSSSETRKRMAAEAADAERSREQRTRHGGKSPLEKFRNGAKP